MLLSHFEGIRVISLINQVGFSGSFEESKRDVTYRNDPMKYVDKEKKKERGKKTERKILMMRCSIYSAGYLEASHGLAMRSKINEEEK
ncbi:hypothetical protein MGK_01274 [Candida albicans P57055]|nr:hypothetical protein MGK_01274 [Candida albicans P57055]